MKLLIPQKWEGIANGRATGAVLRALQHTRLDTKTCAKNPDSWSPNDPEDESLELKLG